MKRHQKVFGDCYQLAGQLLLIPAGDPLDNLTEGQRDRLIELLLNVLSEEANPNSHYTSKLIWRLRKLAVAP